MGKQSQSVENNSVAIQSGGDTTLHVGLSPGEVQDLIHSTLTAAMPALAAVAIETARERMTDFELKVYEKLGCLEERISAATLKDPDFHFVLSKAGQSYARSGDSQIGDTLVDLIAQRACERGRTRLALTLNDALEKTALLTDDEFATLSLCYILRRTLSWRVISWQALVDWLSSTLPFLKDAETHKASCEYLASNSCGQLNELASASLHDIMIHNYLGVCVAGFDKEAALNKMPSEFAELVDDQELFIPCLHDKTKLQVNALNKKVFEKLPKRKILTPEAASAVWQLHERSAFNEKILMAMLTKDDAKIAMLANVWNSTLAHFNLTTTGITIAHANARRVVDFKADLNIWVK